MHIQVPLFLWAVEVTAACAVSCVTARPGTDWCSDSSVWREQESASICMVSWTLFLLGQTLVSKSLFSIISFFLMCFFSVLTSLKASFICSHRAAGAVQFCCKVLGVTGRHWPLHQKVSISQYFGGLFQVFFYFFLLQHNHCTILLYSHLIPNIRWRPELLREGDCKSSSW